MVLTFGDNIVSAFTNGSSVKAIYANGVKVWPIRPVPSGWYIMWDPIDASGTFSIEGTTYNLEDYSGCFTGYSGVITQSAFVQASITNVMTNATSIGSNAFYWCSSLQSVRAASCTYVDNGAFSYCSELQDVRLPNCEYIGPYAFYNCDIDYTSGLSIVSFPECEYIGHHAFAYCTYLRSAYFPKCSYIGQAAFNLDVRLSNVSFPECEYIGPYAFMECSSLKSIILPQCSYIDHNAFHAAASLSNISIPLCESIGVQAFYACQRLSVVDLPSCTYLAESAFNADTGLTYISLPVCSYIGSGVFAACNNLPSIDLPVCGHIGESCFYSCISLSVITLRSTSVCEIESSVFYLTPIGSGTGSIYVPASLVSDYKVAQYWSDYASQIVGYGPEPGPDSSSETIIFSDYGIADREVVDYDQSGTVFKVGSFEVKFTKSDSGTGTPATYYAAQSAVRLYNGCSVVIESDRVISSVQFTWSSTYKPAADDANPPGYDPNIGTWTGSSNSVTLTKTTTSNWRLMGLTVTYEE